MFGLSSSDLFTFIITGGVLYRFVLMDIRVSYLVRVVKRVAIQHRRDRETMIGLDARMSAMEQQNELRKGA